MSISRAGTLSVASCSSASCGGQSAVSWVAGLRMTQKQPVPNCGAPRWRLATVGLRGSPGIFRRGLPGWAGLSLKASWRSLSSARSWRPSLSCRRSFIAVTAAWTAGRRCPDSHSLRAASHTQGCRDSGTRSGAASTGRGSPLTSDPSRTCQPWRASWSSMERRSSSPGPVWSWPVSQRPRNPRRTRRPSDPPHRSSALRTSATPCGWKSAGAGMRSRSMPDSSRNTTTCSRVYCRSISSAACPRTRWLMSWPLSSPGSGSGTSTTLRGSRTRPPVLNWAFYAARSYSLMRPPRTGRRIIRLQERSAAGWSGRGGRS